MITANFLNSSEVTTDRLFQWDIGQQLKIENIGSATTPNVHFCNKKSDNALVVEIKDGVYNIPNTLLAEEYDITAFIYVGDETEAKTIKVIHIPVTKRTKPSSYIYTTDEDVIDFMAVSAEIHSLLDGLVITPYDNTKTYKKPNMVYYMGQSYICKSDTEITGILPTDDTKWGLMCKNGANISSIGFYNDTLTFTLDSGDLIGVPLNTSPLELYKDTIDNIIGLKLTQDENGVLKLGDVIIPQKKLVFNGEAIKSNTTPEDFGVSVILNTPLIQQEQIHLLFEVEVNLNFYSRVDEGLSTWNYEGIIDHYWKAGTRIQLGPIHWAICANTSTSNSNAGIVFTPKVNGTTQVELWVGSAKTEYYLYADDSHPNSIKVTKIWQIIE